MAAEVITGSDGVRLTGEEKKLILQAVEAVTARYKVDWRKISVFGSRTELNARGGDIDLYIEIINPHHIDLSDLKRTLKQATLDRIGEQKLDLFLDSIDERTGVAQFDGSAFRELVLKTKKDLWIKKHS